MFYKCYVGLFLLMFKVAASIENGFVVNGNFDLGGGAEFSQNGFFRLTNSSTFGVGRAFYSQPLNFKNSSNGSSVSFSTTFVFAFNVLDKEHLPDQGMAFMIAPSKNLTGASSSQYLGLFNSTNNGDPSNHVVAIELDTSLNPEFKDINRNHVGINVNSLESVKSDPVLKSEVDSRTAQVNRSTDCEKKINRSTTCNRSTACKGKINRSTAWPCLRQTDAG